MCPASSVAQTVRRVAGEHDHLRRLLAQVEAAFGRPEPHTGSGPDVVAARLDCLRGSLRAHLEEEERLRLLETIEEHAPEHAAECARLRGEHSTLIRLLDSLRSASPVERRGPVWLREVRRFLDAAKDHETQETKLLGDTLADSTHSTEQEGDGVPASSDVPRRPEAGEQVGPLRGISNL